MNWKIKSLAAAFIILLGVTFIARNYLRLPEKKFDDLVTIIFPSGSSLTQIADTLKQHKLINDDKLFVFWAKTLGYERKMKAGMFRVPTELTYPQLAAFLAETKSVDITLTLIEGWSTKAITQQLQSSLQLDGKIIDSLISDSSFCKFLGVEGSSLNGYLLPDTYVFPFGISEKQVLTFLVNKTLAIFEIDSVLQRLNKTGYSVHQILTLASIVEGEAMLDSERNRIASVYWNRLKRHIRLQADPTIQYILPDGPRRLLYKDLEIDSPYNTYRYAGLPPGPINNPGAASIMAALYPEQTAYLYFVAKGDGGHVFSRTGAEHLRAKSAFNKVRREVARKKRYQKGN